VETHLDSVLVTAKGSPLLAFFDPFGLGIPFLALTNQVMGRPERKTEVILNFSLPGLRRNAGKVLSTKPGLNPKFTKAALTTGRRMDEYLGGGWWRTIWTDGRPDREERILGQYLALLNAALGNCGYLSVPVANRPGGPPVYCLIFLTR